ncbi:hypothetical protein [Roseomonas chloroacetimidivorans]|uniref:hypothetical protein n=1 Tax=Roseomonas chloroacetimidivorans TaxID=1766656 RepID=UPI003C7918D7
MKVVLDGVPLEAMTTDQIRRCLAEIELHRQGRYPLSYTPAELREAALAIGRVVTARRQLAGEGK